MSDYITFSIQYSQYMDDQAESGIFLTTYLITYSLNVDDILHTYELII